MEDMEAREGRGRMERRETEGWEMHEILWRLWQLDNREVGEKEMVGGEGEKEMVGGEVGYNGGEPHRCQWW